MAEDRPAQERRTDSLRADCASCVGLCCVALAFPRSADFAFDKEAGDPCTHLQDDFRCGIHPVLRERGFKGCTVFDCLGAGQKVTQVTFAGQGWREVPQSRELMFATFQVMRPLHELLWYLNEAMARARCRPLQEELVRAYDETELLTRQSADDVLAVDVGAQRDLVNVLLSRVSELVRADARRGRKPSKAMREVGPGTDLVGAKLGGLDLRGANLRGAHLIGADLRRADLCGADLIGADVRDADLSGADLSETLFLTQLQVSAARGDAGTRLPSSLTRPTHWTG